MSTPAQRTCAICGRTMTQRALYLQPSYSDQPARWLCRSLRACAAVAAKQLRQLQAPVPADPYQAGYAAGLADTDDGYPGQHGAGAHAWRVGHQRGSEAAAAKQLANLDALDQLVAELPGGAA